jgi:hypothetical protein
LRNQQLCISTWRRRASRRQGRLPISVSCVESVPRYEGGGGGSEAWVIFKPAPNAICFILLSSPLETNAKMAGVSSRRRDLWYRTLVCPSCSCRVGRGGLVWSILDRSPCQNNKQEIRYTVQWKSRVQHRPCFPTSCKVFLCTLQTEVAVIRVDVTICRLFVSGNLKQGRTIRVRH